MKSTSKIGNSVRNPMRIPNGAARVSKRLVIDQESAT
jgi:hypothetical protein